MKGIFKKILLGLLSITMSMGALRMAACDGNGNDNTKFEDPGDEGIQYAVLVVSNTYYEKLDSYIRTMVEQHDPIDPTSKRMYAFGVYGPMCITQSIEQMQSEVNYVFKLAEKHNVPVYFQMDDCTNYTTAFGDEATIDDKGTRFYEDPEMCEWVAFPEEGEEWGGQSYGMLPRWHCNWSGNPFATAGGFPCYNSEKYLAWYTKQVQEGFIKPLIENYSRLVKLGKGYLFAGVSTGWETQIPNYTNSSMHSLQDFEKAQYGMHALYNMGYDAKKLKKEAAEKHVTVEALQTELLYQVLADYIEYTCKLFDDAGIGRHKIFSHTVSISSSTGVETTEHPPLWVSINDYCTPGWTMSPKTCPYNIDKVHATLAQYNRNEYANTEGYAHYDNVENCRDYFKESLLGNARLVTAFCYDVTTATSKYGYDKDRDFYYAQVIREWMNYQLGPDYTWATRPTHSPYLA